MKRFQFLLKWAVVANAVLLVGGFVSYRAGAFDTLLGPGTRFTRSDGSQNHEQNPSEYAPPGEFAAGRVDFEPQLSEAVKSELTLMSGSKSMMAIESESDVFSRVVEQGYIPPVVQFLNAKEPATRSPFEPPLPGAQR